MVQGKKRDPVDVKYDGLIAETRRMFKTIIKNTKINADKKREDVAKFMEAARKEERALFDEAVENMLMTVHGVYEQARHYEKMTNPVIVGLEEKADYWEGRVDVLEAQLKRIYSENRELKKERDQLKAFNDTLLKEMGKGGADDDTDYSDYFCED